MKNQFFLLILNLFTVSLFAFNTPEIRRIISNEVLRFEHSIIYMRSTVEIFNPNFITLNFNKITLTFDGGKYKIANGQTNGPTNLKSKQSSEVVFEIRIYLDSMSNNYLNSLIEKDSIDLGCKVTGTLGIFDIKISEKINFQLSTKELFEPIKNDFIKNTKFNINDIKILNADLNKINLKIPLTVENTFPFDIHITGIEIKMYSDANCNTKVGEVKDTVEVILLPGKKTTFDKEMILNTVISGLSGIFKVVQRELDYYIKGNIHFQIGKHNLTIPLKEKILVDPFAGTIR
jgi:LEA14-like dessication related protein